MHPHEPLPLEARRVLWRKVWDRLLQPLPTEVIVDAGDATDPPDPADQHRDKELAR
jgi:hypothetical protein